MFNKTILAEDWCLISLACNLPRMSRIFVYTLGHQAAIFASAFCLFDMLFLLGDFEDNYPFKINLFMREIDGW